MMHNAGYKYLIYKYLANTSNYLIIRGVPVIKAYFNICFSWSQKNISNKIEFGVIA